MNFLRSFMAIFCLCAALVVVFGVGAYDITQEDLDELDLIEERLFDAIDESTTWWPEEVIDALEEYMEEISLSDRLYAMLTIMIDDIAWVYLDEAYEYEDEWKWYMLPEDCHENEYYDADEEWCYPVDQWVDREYDFDGSYVHDDEIEWNPTIYAIQGDEIKLVTEWDDLTTDEHQMIWEIFVDLIPANIREDLVQFHVMYDEDSDEYAHVAQTHDDMTQRYMQVNSAIFFPDGEFDAEESIHTLLHEFAHILTLNKTQVDYVSEDILENDELYLRYAENCPTYFISEGCLFEDTLLEDFIDMFWEEDDLESVWYDEKSVYKNNENDFITEYASTNPEEDIAESFVAYMLDINPKVGSLAEDKIQFFDEYSDMVKLQSFIQQRLGKRLN